MPTGRHHQHSDLAQGRFSTPVVEKLFIASRYLFAIKPWTLVKAHQVLRMDIPTLGIDGACLSIIGQLGESRGVLIFPSLDGFERFLVAANASGREHGAITMGTELVSLTFQHAAELPPSMYREAMRNALPVESPDAYPLVAHRNANGIPQLLGDRDVETATACALALSAFLPKHAGIFQADSFTPVCESYFDDDDREVRFAVPYEASADFQLNEPAEQERDAYLSPTPPAEPFQPRVGRNRPCPCGSGRKYKKCHLPADEAEHDATRSLATTLPPLRDRDGDRLLTTVDHFEVTLGAMPKIDARLAHIEGAKRERADEDSVAYMVVTNDETQPAAGKTVIGRVWLTPTALRLETGSQERADALRQLVEALCGTRIRHRAREHTDLPAAPAP